MTITEAIFDLRQFAGLQSLIGSRLYPAAPAGLPQGAELPAITFQRISGVPEFTHNGRDPLTKSRYQFNLYGRKPLECDALASALDAALKARYGGVYQILNLFDRSEPDTKKLFYAMDVMLSHQWALAS